MKTKISALMDGELDGREAQGAFEALRGEGEARDAWRTYHLIGDSMRETRMLSAGFAQRVSAALEQEPTVLAPRTRPILEQRRWQILSAAASLAAVGFVSLAFFSQEAATPGAPVAAGTAQPAEIAKVAPPEAA